MNKIIQSKYDPGSKKRNSSFTIWIDCVHHGNFIVSKESRVDVFFKNIGISVEPQTNDPQFDARFYIQTENVEFARAYFLSEEKRMAVRKVFDLDFNSIKFDGKSMLLIKQPCPPTLVLPLTEPAKELLDILMEGMDALPSSSIAGQPAWKFKKYLFYTVAFGAGITGSLSLIFFLCHHYIIIDSTGFLKLSIQSGLLALGIFTALAVFFLKGRSSSHRDIIIIFFISLFSIPWSTYSIMYNTNCSLDKTPIRTYHCLVTDKNISTTRGKNGINYHYNVYLQLWRTDITDKKIEVSYSKYQQIIPQKTQIKVHAQDGRWGYEWFTPNFTLL